MRTSKKGLGNFLVLIIFMFVVFPTQGVVQAQGNGPTSNQCSPEDLAFAWPLADFTFGVYGYHSTVSYGWGWDLFGSTPHAIVHSPINGVVTQKFVDGQGSTAIQIANKCQMVWMIHGNWDEVEVGDEVKVLDIVGTQDNHGKVEGLNGPCNDEEGCAEHIHFGHKNLVTGEWIDTRATDEKYITETPETIQKAEALPIYGFPSSEGSNAGNNTFQASPESQSQAAATAATTHSYTVEIQNPLTGEIDSYDVVVPEKTLETVDYTVELNNPVTGETTTSNVEIDWSVVIPVLLIAWFALSLISPSKQRD